MNSGNIQIKVLFPAIFKAQIVDTSGDSDRRVDNRENGIQLQFCETPSICYNILSKKSFSDNNVF